MKTRREFLKDVTTITALAAGGASAATTPSNGWGQSPIAIFEKVFEALSYDELADAVAEIGADGVEATIRPKGHIEPVVAADEVPKMQAAMRKRGKRIVIAATGIGRVDEPHSESLLRTLKSEGITHYRMAHYHLDPRNSMKQQVAEYAAQAKDLAAMNKAIGIQGLYQNHSGARNLGALAWDAAYMLDGIDPDALGLALDTRHLVKDSGSSWKTAVAVCKPHVRSIYVKDGMWYGPRGDQYKDVKLDTGFVNAGVFNEIRKGLMLMSLCIHMEWLGYRVFKKSEIPSAIDAHKKDLAALRRWLAK